MQWISKSHNLKRGMADPLASLLNKFLENEFKRYFRELDLSPPPEALHSTGDFQLVGANMSEPHTSELNCNFSYIYIYEKLQLSGVHPSVYP